MFLCTSMSLVSNYSDKYLNKAFLFKQMEDLCVCKIFSGTGVEEFPEEHPLLIVDRDCSRYDWLGFGVHMDVEEMSDLDVDFMDELGNVEQAQNCLC